MDEIEPVASNGLGVDFFTAPGNTMVGERPWPFGDAFGNVGHPLQRTSYVEGPGRSGVNRRSFDSDPLCLARPRSG